MPDMTAEGRAEGAALCVCVGWGGGCPQDLEKTVGFVQASKIKILWPDQSHLNAEEGEEITTAKQSQKRSFWT